MPNYKLSDLDIDEVSLVDRPAIKRRFYVVKRDSSEGENMSEQETPNLSEEQASAIKSALQTLGKLVGIGKADDMEDDSDDDKAKKMSDKDKMKKEEDDMPNEEMVTKAQMDEVVKSIEDKITKAFEAKFEKAEQEKQEALNRVAELEKAASLRECRDYVVAKNWAGSADENATLMMTMKSALPEEAYRSWLAREDARSAEVEKSALFEEIGTHFAKAQDNMVDMVKKAQQDGSDYDALLKSIDPNEYAKYQREQEQRVNRTLHGIN